MPPPGFKALYDGGIYVIDRIGYLHGFYAVGRFPAMRDVIGRHSADVVPGRLFDKYLESVWQLSRGLLPDEIEAKYVYDNRLRSNLTRIYSTRFNDIFLLVEKMRKPPTSPQSDLVNKVLRLYA